MRIKNLLKWGSGILFCLYLLYVASAAVFLNTSLFAHAAKMNEEDQTYIRFRGAYSLYPGHLYVPHARVFISDQNVSIGIEVDRVRARFNLKPILKKRFDITSVDIDQIEVDVGMKTLQESQEYTRKYAKAADLDLKARAAKAVEDEKNHLTLDFKKIRVGRITHVRGGFGRFDGEMALEGGFMIQPKVKVEVYPSTLTFLSGIVGKVTMNIEQFRTLDAPGNAVFPYMNADLDFRIDTDSLRRFDFQLSSLPGYSLDGIGSNGEFKIRIVKGVLQEGSHVDSLPSRITLNTPSLSAAGLGRLRWVVDRKQSSLLTTRFRRLRISDKTAGHAGSSAVNRGQIRQTDLRVRLFGNQLVDAFHGLSLALSLNGLDWKLVGENGRSRNFDYSGKIRGGGVLTGYAGQVPASARGQAAKPSKLELSLDDLKFKTTFIRDMSGTGKIQVTAAPIDLAVSKIVFPQVTTDLNLQLGKYGEVKTRAQFSRLEHQYAPDDTWKGQLTWGLDRTDPLVEALAESGALNGIIKSLAKVRDLELQLDCEVNDDQSWIRLNHMKSTGVWKGYGTLKNSPFGMKGLFELSVLGLPVGLKIYPDQTETKFLPGQEWYDEYFQHSQPVLPESRLPLGATKKAGGAI